jgi:L-alanine-DL-glutamate epimerase-like enolase superfamily enzyme
MKIERIEILHYRLPLDPPFHAAWDPRPRTSSTSTIVRVYSGGFDGVGSGDAMLGFDGNEELFIGQNVFDFERHARILDNLQFHYGRMWPLEIALWDLAGRIKGQPLWKLLRDGAWAPSPAIAGDMAQPPSAVQAHAAGRVPVYASTGERRSADDRAASVVALRDAGLPAVKLRFHAEDPADDIATVHAVRDAIGSHMRILVDANQGWRMPWDASRSWDFDTALDVARLLADLDVYWLEEPLHRHDYDGLARLRRELDGSGLRIAGGEGNRELADFDQYLAHNSLDVFQPDVAWATGVLRATQLAVRVRESGAMYSPHTWGDSLVLLANLHVAAACSNAPFVEYPYDPPAWTPDLRDFMLRSPVVARDGYVDLGDAPGLGAQIDWDELESRRVRAP